MNTNTSKVRQGVAALGLAATMLVGSAGVASAAEGDAGPGGQAGPAASAAQGARRHPGVVHVRRVAFRAAAGVLGQEPKELLQAMAENGQTLAQVAGDQAGAVIDAAVAAVRAAVEAAHDAGKLTDEQYQKLVARMDANLVDRVTFVVEHWVPRPRSQS